MTPRIKKEATYQSFRLQKRLPRDKKAMVAASQLMFQSWAIFKKHWRSLQMLVLIFTSALVFLFLPSAPSIDLVDSQALLARRFGESFWGLVQQSLELISQAISNFLDQAILSLGLFVVLNLIFGLILWRVMRYLSEGRSIKVLEALYFGPAQFIPYLFLFVLVFLHTLPALIVSDLATSLRDSGVLTSYFEQTATFFIIAAIFVATLYYLVGGLYSLVIVSLSGVKPLEAWQASWRLVHRRRLKVILYLSAAVLVCFVVACLLLLPLVWLLPQVAHYGAYVVYLQILVFLHIYVFLLYQNLLKITKQKGD